MKFLPILITAVAGLSTLIGYFFIYVKSKNISKLISIFLAFSVGVIFTLSIIDLLPEGLKMMNNIVGINVISIIIAFVCFLVGYYLVKLISILEFCPTNELSRVGVITFIILFIHNALEGIATYYTSTFDTMLGIKFAIGIILHNIPEGILIALPIYHGSGNKLKSFLLVLFSGFSELAGALIGIGILKDGEFITSISYMMFIIIGLMISLAINEIIPEVKRNLYIKEDIIALILGIMLIVVNSILF